MKIIDLNSYLELEKKKALKQRFVGVLIVIISIVALVYSKNSIDDQLQMCCVLGATTLIGSFGFIFIFIGLTRKTLVVNIQKNFINDENN